MKCAGIVLCGGQSRRMGTDKAWLPFGGGANGPETMLQRIVRILGEAVSPVVVVAAATARLPELPPDVRIAFDRQPDRGPLEGLAVGLSKLPADVVSAYVTSCDAPLLRPAFIRRMVELPGDEAVAVPNVDGRLHPLAAVYRLTVLPEVERRLAENQLRLTELVESLHPRIVHPEELRDIDPDLQSLRNINDPEEYRAALAISLRSSSPTP